MIDKNLLDKIYVKTNDQMTEVIRWTDENLDSIRRVVSESKIEFPTYPMQSGLVWMEEEMIDFSFEVQKDGNVRVYHFPGHMPNPMFSFTTRLDVMADNLGELVKDIDWPGTGDVLKDLELQYVIAMDNTPVKTWKKFYCLMLFMLFNDGEVIKVDQSKSETRTKREVRYIKSRTGNEIPLVKKTYIITNFEPKKVRVAGAPRNYTKPDHEVRVRGHYRHLKSGKVIWIKEHSNYKNKGKGNPKVYKL